MFATPHRSFSRLRRSIGPFRLATMNTVLCSKTSGRKAMAVTSSRREVLHFGFGTAAALRVSALAPVGALRPVRALPQGAPAGNASVEDFFYPQDLIGQPRRKP